MSKRVQVKGQRRRRGWTMADVLPLDPRDLKVLRAKAMVRASTRAAWPDSLPGAAQPCGHRRA